MCDSIDYKFLRQWGCNNTVNPYTGRPIKINSVTWKKLYKYYEEEYSKVDSNKACPVCNKHQKTADGFCDYCINIQEKIKTKKQLINKTKNQKSKLNKKTVNENSILIDYDFIRKWNINDTINPNTGRVIKKNSTTWKNLNKYYNKEYNKINNYIDESDDEENITIDYDFIKIWRSNDTINPNTGRAIKRNSATWKKLRNYYEVESAKLGPDHKECPACNKIRKTPDGYCDNCLGKNKSKYYI